MAPSVVFSQLRVAGVVGNHGNSGRIGAGAPLRVRITLSHKTMSASLSLDEMRSYAFPAAACFNIHPMRRPLEFATELLRLMPRGPLAGYRISSGAASGYVLAVCYASWRRLSHTLAQDIPRRLGVQAAARRRRAGEEDLVPILDASAGLL